MRMLPRAVQSDRSSHWGKQDVRVTELHEMVKTKCQAADRPVVACGKLCRSGERGFLPTSRAISGLMYWTRSRSSALTWSAIGACCKSKSMKPRDRRSKKY